MVGYKHKCTIRNNAFPTGWILHFFILQQQMLSCIFDKNSLCAGEKIRIISIAEFCVCTS